MKANRHYYLYAKGWYEETKDDIMNDLIKIQAFKCDASIEYINESHVANALLEIVHKHIESEVMFMEFMKSMYRNVKYANQPITDYGFSHIIAKACLLILANVKVTEIIYPLGDPDPKVLPLLSRKDN